jgi:hypothetical protein
VLNLRDLLNPLSAHCLYPSVLYIPLCYCHSQKMPRPYAILNRPKIRLAQHQDAPRGSLS